MTQKVEIKGKLTLNQIKKQPYGMSLSGCMSIDGVESCNVKIKGTINTTPNIKKINDEIYDVVVTGDLTAVTPVPNTSAVENYDVSIEGGMTLNGSVYKIKIKGNMEVQTIMATIEIGCDTSSGYLFNGPNINYNTLWEDESCGEVSSTPDQFLVGQDAVPFGGTDYYISRTALFFDTSIIPIKAIITAAKISVYTYEDITDWNIVVQN
jgi:hypothetical protein